MNIQQFIYPENQTQTDMRDEWIAYLLKVNPIGCNRVLTRYGFSGRYQPEDEEDYREAIEMLIEQNGTDAIRDLLKLQPEYEAIRELFTHQVDPVIIPEKTMKNATGNENTASDVVSSLPMNDILKAAAVFGLLYVLTQKLLK